MQKIITCLGYDQQAEEAVNFYTSTIPNSKILTMNRAGEGLPIPKGTLLAATFLLNGQEFMALNGGHPFTFSIGMSIVIPCDTQEEIDYLWEKLSEGGQKVQCGWLNDRYGVSWQIVPAVMSELMNLPDSRKRDAVMKALMQMQKIEIAKLKEAAELA
jgi:predicted 3-demethylubiquinone-9 3-methyltransferase (glyoxalase superfamily)